MSSDGGLIAGDPPDLDRIADALEGATGKLGERNQHLSDIRDGISALADGTAALMLAVQGNAERNKQFRWQMLGIAVLALIGIAAVVVIGITNHGLSSKINSCVNVTGQCHQDQVAATAAAVAELEQEHARALAAAVICAQTDTEYDHVLACIQRLVAETP